MREELLTVWWSTSDQAPDRVSESRYCGRCQPHTVYAEAVLDGRRQPLGHRRVRPDRGQYGDSLGEGEVDRGEGVGPEVEVPKELIMRGFGVDRDPDRWSTERPFSRFTARAPRATTPYVKLL